MERRNDQNNVERALRICEEIAIREYDGHYTLMRFTTNWRFCFGTIYDLADMHGIISHMASGDTMQEAIENGIANNISIDSILEEIEQQ